ERRSFVFAKSQTACRKRDARLVELAAEVQAQRRMHLARLFPELVSQAVPLGDQLGPDHGGYAELAPFHRRIHHGGAVDKLVGLREALQHPGIERKDVVELAAVALELLAEVLDYRRLAQAQHTDRAGHEPALGEPVL